MRFVVAGTKEIVPDEVRRVLEQHGYQVLAVDDEPVPDVGSKGALAQTAVIELQCADDAERRPRRESALADRDERLRTTVAAAKVGSWHSDIESGELLWSDGSAEIFGVSPDPRVMGSERRFRELAEAIPHLLWQVDPSGELLYSNRKHREYLGRDSLGFAEWRSVHHPDEHASQLELYARCASSREPIGPCVHRLRSKDGTYGWFASHAVPVSNEKGELEYIIGTSTDVSDLKKAEQELRDAQERLVTALQAAGMGTWRYDPTVGQMEFDDALLALHGYTREEAGVLGVDAAALLIHEDDRELALRTMSDALEHGTDFTVEVRALHKSGSSFWIRTRGRIQRDDGRARMVGASMEITQQKVLEEQLRHAQKMEAIGQLAGGVAHDFNNMLTIIAGRVSLLELASTRSDEIDESLRDISLATERAASLTAQLLAFASRQVLRKRDLDLNQVVANVVRMLARTLGEQIEIAFKPEDRAVVIHADEGMMTQVLLNLAVNARDAMPRGGTLTITTRIVSGDRASATANVEQAEPYALLQVCDTGEGMTPTVLEHVFEPFFTTKPVGKGTGLGLATVYGIVTQHRGSITVDSAPGAGATFRMRFPLRSTPATEAPVARRSTRGRGENVLLVEDEPSVCRLVQRLLEAHGYRVIAVDTGAAAIAAFEANSGRVDLLLTDMVLRGNMTGRELLERLRAERPSLRALLTSGYSIELTTNESGPIHAVPFLRKPFNVEELLRAVRDALARPAQP